RRQDVERHHALVGADWDHRPRAPMRGRGEIVRARAEEGREERRHHGKAPAPGREPAEELALRTFADDADLRVVAAEEAEHLPERRLPGEHRAGDDSGGDAAPERPFDALLEAGAEPGAEEPRRIDQR